MADVGTLSSYKIAALIKDRQTYVHACMGQLKIT